MNYCICLSGGTGTRAGTDVPKQYLKCGGEMMITESLRALSSAPQLDVFVVVADRVWRGDIEAEAGGLCEPGLLFADPGANRQLSIWSGLCRILEERGDAADAGDTVFIHDAARPFVSRKLIDAIYNALPGHDGVLPVLPMKDTVYESSDGKRVDRLLERDRIWAGQTPELFLLDKYAAANRALLPERILSINGSTEPAILAGMDVALVQGDESNFKVTTPGDVARWMSRG